jgi:lipid-A-disaccharide synthase
MQAQGCDVHYDLTRLAVMWFLRVLLNLPTFFAVLRRADHYFRTSRPDAVVLIDYPGFNWHIARRAKAHGIPVFYYGTPQLWAWASWRIGKMRRTVDHALCKLPFEESWYRERGVNATYVGHPYFDELAARQLDAAFVAHERERGRLVTILPGSRTQEVKTNLRVLLTAASKIRQQVPDVRFAIASFKESQAELARAMVGEFDLPVEVHLQRTPELIEAASCALAVSGSVSLELLYHAKPTVIVYQISRLAFRVQQCFRRVRYITLVNLLTTDDLFPQRVATYDRHDPADSHVLMPEYLTCEDRTSDIAQHAIEWLSDESLHAARQQQLQALARELGQGGASQRAAEYIAAEFARRPARAGRLQLSAA